MVFATKGEKTMFDFISYVRDMGVEAKILPARQGVLIHLEVRDPDTGYAERHEITDQEARGCANIDQHTGQVLDQMAARIGRKKAKLYADRYQGNKMREMEKLFRGE